MIYLHQIQHEAVNDAQVPSFQGLRMTDCGELQHPPQKKTPAKKTFQLLQFLVRGGVQTFNK